MFEFFGDVHFSLLQTTIYNRKQISSANKKPGILITSRLTWRKLSSTVKKPCLLDPVRQGT